MYQCFRRFERADGSCGVTPLPKTLKPQLLPKKDDVFMVPSPNALSQGDYHASTLCEYHVPKCEGGDGQMMYVHWNQFKLEEPCDPFGDGEIFCPDNLRLDDSNSNITDEFLRDESCNSYCGAQPTLETYVPSRNMKITFRSNKFSESRGFIMHFECVNAGPRGEEGPGGPKEHDINNIRFTRDAEEFLGDLNLESDEIEFHHREKRFVISPLIKNADDCVELGGFSPPPIPTVS